MQDFKKIGKQLGKCVVFIGLLLVMLLGISHKMENTLKNNDHLVQSRNKNIFRIQKEKKNSIDVIAVGDSLSYTSISPMELWNQYGFTSYICGQSGQTIQESYAMLETALQNQSPKVVLLEAHVMFRGGQGVSNVKSSIEDWGNRNIAIFRCHDVWKSIITNKQYLEEDYKGFALRGEIQPYKNGKYMKKTKKKAVISEEVLSYMDKIQKLCKERGAKLVLVGTPSPRNYNYKRHNSLKEYAEKHSLDFIDLNLEQKEVGINWKTDSLDNGDHLNLLGAKKVSKSLGAYLKSAYGLSDHRGKSRYKLWDKEMKDYTAKTKRMLREKMRDVKVSGKVA